jgi:hypothetical protein
MKNNWMLRWLIGLIISLVSTEYVLANTDSSDDGIGEKIDFSESSPYAGNAFGVRKGKVWLYRGDTSQDSSVAGFDLLEAPLRGDALDAAQEVTAILCNKATWQKNEYYGSYFQVYCPTTGEKITSNLDVLPRDAAARYMELKRSLKTYCSQNGVALQKLTISALSIEKSTDGKFIVRLRLFNGSRDRITVDAPRPSGRYGYVSVGIPGKDVWLISNAPSGKELSRVTIDPGRSFDFSFSGVPYNKIAAGTYDVSAWITAHVHFDDPKTTYDDVSFHSDFKSPLRVTFDRDYPSTQEEREQWEAAHHFGTSFHPAKPDETALYRAVRTHARRNLQQQPRRVGMARSAT